jgi:hypothetical protein
MAQGPVTIFDKSTIQSFSLDEAVIFDNFYRSNIPPVFLVECLADLERDRRLMKSTPEQLVGALAEKTPDMQASANVFHLDILKSELMGKFDLDLMLLRPVRNGGEEVQLGNQQGIIFKPGPETAALRRWARKEFLEAEREHARDWRLALSQLDLKEMSNQVLKAIGPWRKPVSFQDARELTDKIIDSLDPEFLLRFGLNLVGVSEATEWVVNDWITGRRKPLRRTYPYFIHILSINFFFSLLYPTELLKNVKPSHQVDLAYLYYLPFCAVFTSCDRFHVQVAPLFMTAAQTFVRGEELKADLARLNELYLTLPEAERAKSIFAYAPHPPDDSSFLTSRLWDIYLPYWRPNSPNRLEVPADKKEALEEILAKFHAKTATMALGAMPGFDSHDFMELNVSVKAVKGSYVRMPLDSMKNDASGPPASPVT